MNANHARHVREADSLLDVVRAAQLRERLSLPPAPIALLRGLLSAAQSCGASLVSGELAALVARASEAVAGSTLSPAPVTVPRARLDRLWSAIAQDSSRDAIVAAVAALPIGTFGTLEHAAATAPSAAGALAALGRFSEVLYGMPVFSVVHLVDGRAALVYEPPVGADEPLAEIAIARAAKIIAGGAATHGDGSAFAYQQVRGRWPTYRVVLAPEVAAAHFPHGAPGVHAALLDLCMHEVARLAERAPSVGVRWAAREALRTGRDLGMEVIAEAVGQRVRSLQARLQAEGVSYRALVDDARRIEVGRLLTSGTAPRLIQSALGYGDSASLRRASRRWWGVGPTVRAAQLRVS